MFQHDVNIFVNPKITARCEQIQLASFRNTLSKANKNLTTLTSGPSYTLAMPYEPRSPVLHIVWSVTHLGNSYDTAQLA